MGSTATIYWLFGYIYLFFVCNQSCYKCNFWCKYTDNEPTIFIHSGSFLSTSTNIWMSVSFIFETVETFYIRVHIKFELHLFGWHWHNEFCLQELEQGRWVYVSQLYLPLIKRNTCFFIYVLYYFHDPNRDKVWSYLSKNKWIYSLIVFLSEMLFLPPILQTNEKKEQSWDQTKYDINQKFVNAKLYSCKWVKLSFCVTIL